MSRVIRLYAVQAFRRKSRDYGLLIDLVAAGTVRLISGILDLVRVRDKGYAAGSVYEFYRPYRVYLLNVHFLNLRRGHILFVQKGRGHIFVKPSLYQNLRKGKLPYKAGRRSGFQLFYAYIYTLFGKPRAQLLVAFDAVLVYLFKGFFKRSIGNVYPVAQYVHAVSPKARNPAFGVGHLIRGGKLYPAYDLYAGGLPRRDGLFDAFGPVVVRKGYGLVAQGLRPLHEPGGTLCSVAVPAVHMQICLDFHRISSLIGFFFAFNA